MTRKFVTAAAGARDSYNLPIALRAEGMLAKHVTDFYSPDLAVEIALKTLPDIHKWLSKRRSAALPSRCTEGDWRSIASIAIDKRKHDAVKLNRLVGQLLSEHAAALANRFDCDLFLYSGAAYWAFKKNMNRERLMFQFHPHVDFARAILETDIQRHPEMMFSYQRSSDSVPLNQVPIEEREEWKFASRILCASTFTKESLIRAGCPSAAIVVAPYGGAVPKTSTKMLPSTSGNCQFIFVGQGIHRKGPHLLLKAWEKAKLTSSELTLVCYVQDPGLKQLADQPRVSMLGRQSLDDLERIYARSDVFVLPSLVEGFGLVLPEALSQGLYCIASTNTGLTDLNPTEEVGQIVQAGDVEQLAEALVAAEKRWNSKDLDKASIRRFSQLRAWSDFRDDIAIFARGAT